MDWKKRGAVVTVGAAGLVAAAVIVTRVLCRGLTFSFEAPHSIRVCKPYTLKGDIIKDCKGLADIPVTIYTELLGIKIPVTTVTTDSIGHYKWEAVLGAETHRTTYFGTGMLFWAEATIEDVLHETERIPLMLYGKYCDGPCPGTMGLQLRRKR